MTEAEALDMAARAAGWEDWYEISHEDLPATHQGIRAHAAAIMENAALKRECERLREACHAIWQRGVQRDPKWFGMTASDIARTALERIDNEDR